MLNHLGCNRIVLKLNINKNKQSNQFNSIHVIKKPKVNCLLTREEMLFINSV